MKILITGHEGFVGRHFWNHFESEKLHYLAGLDIKKGLDCRDYFRSQCREESPIIYDLVIHCAAIVGGREKIEGEPLTVATDLSIDAEMFNWAVKTKQKRIVYFSSSAAYPNIYQTGDRKVGGIDLASINLEEGDINLQIIHQPDLTYGWTKLTGEMLAGFAQKQGINVHIIRPFSGYGTDQDETYPFPSFIKRIKDKVDPFIIWGNGEQVRDFIHIDDIVGGVLAVIEKDVQTPINMGNGIPVSFNSLASQMFSVANWFPENGIQHDTSKPVGVMYRVANPTKFFDIYQPKVTLSEGIEKALNGII